MAIAIELANSGADIIGVSGSMPAAGSDVEKAVLAAGKKFYPYQADFANRDSVYAFLQKVVTDHPKIDILINNAGSIQRSPAAEHPDQHLGLEAEQQGEGGQQGEQHAGFRRGRRLRHRAAGRQDDGGGQHGQGADLCFTLPFGNVAVDQANDPLAGVRLFQLAKRRVPRPSTISSMKGMGSNGHSTLIANATAVSLNSVG